MSKSIYCSLLLIILVFSAGCCTVKGAANGLGQDMHNAADANHNGWNAIKKTDAWIQENMW